MQIAILFQKPHVSIYDKNKKEIISMSAGKSLDMTDKSWTQHRKLKLKTALWEEKTGFNPIDTLE